MLVLEKRGGAPACDVIGEMLDDKVVDINQPMQGLP